ncbi:MAG: mandelate racemase/muconate lactonizing enzyme family protein [Planctomycetales bacterium]|jgi:L-alanine-DL-glutamate epimerase-like enolase superfamily enzyme|nr:mandelate racemase/muconate lactonizing enzyme family protein [Planctomycetales bacterium]
MINSDSVDVPHFQRPHSISRRTALVRGGTALAALASQHLPLLRAQEKANANHPRLKITDIKLHPIQVPYHDWAAHVMNHFHEPSKRIIYEVYTNTGLVGLGETDGPLSETQLQQYIGTSPFDWMATEESPLGFQAALYDLMGQAADVPVYKLIGPKYRSWVPIAAWTVSAHPTIMATTLQKIAALGYTWMKYHLSPFESITDQMRAMQEVAPKGFRIHLDFTMAGTDDHVFELLEKISQFPIAGCFEDPLPTPDIQGHTELRAKCRLPILYHHSPLGAGHETQFRAADGYILGTAPVGSAVRHAGLFAQLDIPFSVQCPGGMILRAMAAHLHAAFKAATLHFNTDTEMWSTDVTNEKLEPMNGWLRVPEAPGLGVTLNRAELERLKDLKLPANPDWIIKSKYPDGTVMYNLAKPTNSLFMVRPDMRKLVTLGYDSPITTEWWDPDGTPAFSSMMKQLLQEGMILEKGGVRVGGGLKMQPSKR